MGKRITALLLCLALCLLCACSSAGPETSVSEEDLTGTLAVGIVLTELPLAARDRVGIVGFEPEYAELLGKALGRRIRLVELTSAEAQTALTDGKADLLMGVEMTSESVPGQTCIPYRGDNYVAVMQTGRSMANAEDLRGMRVAVVKDSPAAGMLAADPALKNSFASTVYPADLGSALEDLMVSAYDAVLTGETRARYALMQDPENLHVTLSPLYENGIPVGCTVLSEVHPALAESLGRAVSELYESGEAGALCQKWFGEDLTYHPETEETGDLPGSGS